MTENEEILDIYDGERRPMGYTKRRDEPLEPGEFIVAVGIWIVDDKGRLLITKRSMKSATPPARGKTRVATLCTARSRSRR